MLSKTLPVSLVVVGLCGLITGVVLAQVPAPVAAPPAAPAQLLPEPAPAAAPSEPSIVFRDATPVASSADAPAPAFDARAIVVALILLLAAVAAWWLGRRRERPGTLASPRLRVLSSLRLGGKWQVSLVQVPGGLLVVGATDKGVTLLTELGPAPNEVPEPDILDMTPPLPPLEPDAGDDDDPFLERLLGRMSDARPAALGNDPLSYPRTRVSPPPIARAAGADERAALRHRIRQYQRGPTQL